MDSALQAPWHGMHGFIFSEIRTLGWECAPWDTQPNFNLLVACGLHIYMLARCISHKYGATVSSAFSCPDFERFRVSEIDSAFVHFVFFVMFAILGFLYFYIYIYYTCRFLTRVGFLHV